ncbi:GA-binding protein alpha chain [Crotalus adamanteus]|uniref:GA-binding protein alpha chain n=1 Tax=Crotalus adamanteus TaxID=8729 RepID=A0AAW1BJI3_CROAD
MTKREAEELIEIEIDGTEKQECTEESIVEQTYTTAEFVSQAIDINEPVGNLKKLLEPRLQCSLEAHEICLQDIQLDPDRSLFDQGVKTDGTVQLSVQVISRQGMDPKLNILEIVKPVETVEVVIDPDAHHTETEAHLVEETQTAVRRRRLWFLPAASLAASSEKEWPSTATVLLQGEESIDSRGAHGGGERAAAVRLPLVHCIRLQLEKSSKQGSGSFIAAAAAQSHTQPRAFLLWARRSLSTRLDPGRLLSAELKCSCSSSSLTPGAKGRFSGSNPIAALTCGRKRALLSRREPSPVTGGQP